MYVYYLHSLSSTLLLPRLLCRNIMLLLSHPQLMNRTVWEIIGTYMYQYYMSRGDRTWFSLRFSIPHQQEGIVVWSTLTLSFNPTKSLACTYVLGMCRSLVTWVKLTINSYYFIDVCQRGRTIKPHPHINVTGLDYKNA